MMNAIELNNTELEMVNGGDNTVVIDLSKHDNIKALGPVPGKRNGYKSLGELRLEERLADMQRGEPDQVSGGANAEAYVSIACILN